MDAKKRIYLISRISKLVASLNTKEKQIIFSEILRTTQECIPISVFKANISCFEIIVKYLKEVENFSFKPISKILNRRLSTIYNTYANSKLKFKGKFDLSNTSICIPYYIFANRKYSILETIVAYLIDKENLSVNDVSKLLNKNQITVRTVYRRYKIKYKAK